MMRVEINNDRDLKRPDPVATGEGVFGVLETDETSRAEAARIKTKPAPKPYATVVEVESFKASESKAERMAAKLTAGGAGNASPEDYQAERVAAEGVEGHTDEPAEKIWTPKRIMNRLTKLYGRFSKPKAR